MNDTRPMPSVIEAERSLLACCLQRPALIPEIREHVKPDDFFRDDHRNLFSFLVRQHLAGSPVDLVTLPTDLQAAGVSYDQVGGLVYLLELPEHAASTANWSHYADLIANTARRRRAIGQLHATTERVYDLADDADGAVNEALADLSGLARNHRDRDQGTLDDALRELDAEEHDRLERADDTGQGGADVVKTGLQAIDRKVAIFRGDLVVLQAHTSHGKTALALNIAENNVVGEDPGPVAFWSAEMRRKLLARRMISRWTGIDGFRQRMGWLDDQERETWAAGVRRLAGAPLWINHRSGMTIHQLVAWVTTTDRQVRDLGWPGLRLVVVDYLQRMAPSSRRMSRIDAVTEMSREVKDLAVRLDVPILVLCQPNRVALGNTDKRPQLHHLRESGAIEQDADTVLAGYYHAKTLPENQRDEWINHYEIEIQKQRNGATGRGLLHFTPQATAFRDVTSHEYQTWGTP